MPCPGCGTEGKNHALGCPYEGADANHEKAGEKAKELVADPRVYEAWLKESMAAHLVRLDVEARKGDVKAAQAFRIGALEVLEVLDDAEEEGRAAESTAAGSHPRSGKQGSAAARAIARAVGKSPSGVAGGEGRRREPSGDDEGRTGSDAPDQAIPD